MGHVAVCRICIADNVLMYSIADTELQTVYERLTTVPLYRGRKPLTVCYICYSQLKASRQLMLKALKAEEVLGPVLSGEVQLSALDRQTLNLTSSLAVSLINNFMMGVPLPEDVVKEEPSEDGFQDVLQQTQVYEGAGIQAPNGYYHITVSDSTQHVCKVEPGYDFMELKSSNVMVAESDHHNIMLTDAHHSREQGSEHQMRDAESIQHAKSRLANRVSNDQLDKLLDFLTKHPALTRGVGVGTRSKETLDKQWNDLATKLNSFSSGSSKSGERWKKYWADLKHKIKFRLAKRRRDASGPGAGLNSQDDLSEIEKKVLAIIGEQAVFGDIMHSVPNMDPLASQRENIMVQLEIKLPNDKTETVPASTVTIHPSATRQTCRTSNTSERPTASPACIESKPQHVPQPSSTGESRVCRPTFDRRRSKRMKPNIKTIPSKIEPEWVMNLERRRVDAEQKIADAALMMAESAREQAGTARALAGLARRQHADVRALLALARARHPPHPPTDNGNLDSYK